MAARTTFITRVRPTIMNRLRIAPQMIWPRELCCLPSESNILRITAQPVNTKIRTMPMIAMPQ